MDTWIILSERSIDFKRADYNYEHVYINKQGYRICKCADNFNIIGKWILFNNKDYMLGKTISDGPPFRWADDLIKKNSERNKEKYAFSRN